MRKFNRVVGGSLVAADREKRDLWTGRLQGQNYEFSIRLKRCVRLDTLGRPRASIYTMFRSVIILDWKEEKRYWGNTAISIIIIRKRRQHLRIKQARHQLFVETLLWCERNERLPDTHTWAWTDRMDLYVQFNPDVTHSFSNRMTPVRVWT